MDNKTCLGVTFCSGKGRATGVCISVLVGLVVILVSASAAPGKQYKLVSYGEGPVQEPRYRTLYDKTGWSKEMSALPIGGRVRWSLLRACPKREEAILGVVDANQHLHVQVWDGSQWSNPLELVSAFLPGDSRFFDIAYESKSGDALVVYGYIGARNPRYRIWDGVSWSTEGVISLPGTRTRPQLWITLTPDPNSDEIVLVCQDEFRRLYTSIWDGGSWGNSIGDFDRVKSEDYLCFGASREGQSGEVLLLWRPEAQGKLNYMVWDGVAWGPQLESTELPRGVDAGMIEMTSDPQSNRIMVGLGDIHGDLAVSVWSGSEWGAFQKVADNYRVVGKNRGWDLMFEGKGGRGLLVYSDADDCNLRYRIYDEVWGLEQIGPTLKSSINVLELERDRFGNEAILLSLSGGWDIESVLWDGSQFFTPYELETDASFNIYQPLASVYVEDFTPGVAVLSPNGGETLAVWDTVGITWVARSALGIDSVSVEFSTDAGRTWSVLSSSEPNDSLYLWSVPPTPSESCLVAVTAFDVAGLSERDESDELFAIADLTPPDVSVLFPNGGEVFEVGDTIDIEWTASDYFGIDFIDVQFSCTGGLNWETLYVNLENDSIEQWIIPSTVSMYCLVRIIARDTFMNANADESDSVFAIRDRVAPEVTVISPNGGEMWAVGDTNDIRWFISDTSVVESVSVYYSASGGLTWQALGVGTGRDTSIRWEIPNTVSDACLVRLKAYMDSLTFLEDESDSVFSIFDKTPPNVTVIFPNGGETLVVGDTVHLDWSAWDVNGVDSVTVHLSTDNGGGWTSVAVDTRNDPARAWAVPPLISDSCLLRVNAYDPYLNEGFDVSDSVFSIVDRKPPEVLVVSPNGGEAWAVGDTHRISWEAFDDVGVTHIDIYYTTTGTTGAILWTPISLGEPNDLEYTWVVPDEPSDRCLVKIVAFDEAMNNSSDNSDSLFTIYVRTDSTGVAQVVRRGIVPEEFELLQNEPNPFSRSTSIALLAPTEALAVLSIYDCTGRLLKRRAFKAEAGIMRLQWDGRDSSGRLVGPGVYFYHVRAESSIGFFDSTRKMAFLR